MTWKRNVLDAKIQVRSGETLQRVLVDLIELSLQGKQGHWTVKGPNFRSLHKQLDDIVDVARAAADDVAERMAALGCVPDGCAETVANTTTLESFPVRFSNWRAVTDWMADRLANCSRTLQEGMAALQPDDEVSSNMLQDVALVIEKQLWMLQAHEGEEGDPEQEKFREATQRETAASASAG